MFSSKNSITNQCGENGGKISFTDSDSQTPSASLEACGNARVSASYSCVLPALLLEATAFTRGQLVHADAPQIALAGRSNVGKSSLVNALAGRKALAKVSATPGKTRSVNYYRLQGTEAFLVDLPGYGYAKCSHEERKKWGELLQYYFQNTPGLKSLVVLLDARLSPQKADRELIAYASGLGLPLLAVLTKADKCSKKELAGTLRAWEPLTGKDALMVTSSRNRAGIKEFSSHIASLLLGSVPE